MSKLIRHTITTEILYVADTPISFDELRDVDDFVTYGCGSGFRIWEDAVEVSEDDFIDRCDVHGTDPEFFGLTDEFSEVVEDED